MNSRLNLVILIDDDIAAAYLTKVAIQEMGIMGNFIHMDKALDALNFIKEHCLDEGKILEDKCPDLILLNINMSVLNVFDFIE
jgi:two-component SAPR family response regulator